MFIRTAVNPEIVLCQSPELWIRLTNILHDIAISHWGAMVRPHPRGQDWSRTVPLSHAPSHRDRVDPLSPGTTGDLDVVQFWVNLIHEVRLAALVVHLCCWGYLCLPGVDWCGQVEGAPITQLRREAEGLCRKRKGF